jgi:hypothetical protein
MEIRPVVADSFYADRQTAMNKLAVFFAILLKRQKNWLSYIEVS